MRKSISAGFVFCCLFISSCSTTATNEGDPASLLRDAEEDIQSDHYLIALEKLRALKNKFPQSKYATDAQLRIGDVYFLQAAYIEAASAYEAFRDLHPNHEKTPYAMFRIGKSYFNDIPTTVARDLTPAVKSMEAYSDFLKKYASAPESTEAKSDIVKIRNHLADKELSIGDFYFRREFYDSAKPRYKKVIELYPDTAAASFARENLNKIESK